MKLRKTLVAIAVLTTLPLAAEDDPVRKLVEALGRLKISGYVQPQYVHDQSSSDDPGKNRDQFSVRRGRLKFVYQFTPTSRFTLQPEMNSSGVSLKDAYVELTEPWTSWKHTLTAGQFKWPFGYEVGQSSSVREMPERTRVIRALFPGERDRGLMLSGTGLSKRLRYQLAVVNGSGIDQTSDPNSRKDLVGRLTWDFGPLDVGASMYRGADLVVTAFEPSGIEFDKRRTGVEAQWATPVKGLSLRGEYIRGDQAPAAGTARTASQAVEGWYLYAVHNVGTRHQFVLRADEYDGDTDVPDNAVTTLGGAWSYQWDANSKMMVAYEAPRHEAGDRDDDVFTLRYQFSF